MAATWEQGIRRTATMGAITQVCRRFQAFACDHEKRCELQRHVAMLACQSLRLPTLPADIAQFGEPTLLWPKPTWEQWKVQEWLFFENDCVHGTKWYLAGPHWIRDLSDLHALRARMPPSAGLYRFRHLYLSCHCWDYDEPWWQEDDHM